MKISNADLDTARVLFQNKYLPPSIGYLVGKIWIQESHLFPDTNIIPVQLSSFRIQRSLNIYLPFSYINYPVVLI